MSKITESITVNAPRTAAYEQWSRFEELPKFMTGVLRVDVKPGDVTHWVVEVGGVTREFEAKVLSAADDHRVSWTSTAGPKHSGSVEFASVDAGATRVTASMDIDPEGFVEKAGDKLGILNLKIRRDLERFKELMEAPADPRGSRQTT